MTGAATGLFDARRTVLASNPAQLLLTGACDGLGVSGDRWAAAGRPDPTAVAARPTVAESTAPAVKPAEKVMAAEALETVLDSVVPAAVVVGTALRARVLAGNGIRCAEAPEAARAAGAAGPVGRAVTGATRAERAAWRGRGSGAGSVFAVRCANAGFGGVGVVELGATAVCATSGELRAGPLETAGLRATGALSLGIWPVVTGSRGSRGSTVTGLAGVCAMDRSTVGSVRPTAIRPTAARARPDMVGVVGDAGSVLTTRSATLRCTSVDGALV